MGPSYDNSVKNAAEEFSELLGYLLILFAMLEYVIERRGKIHDP